MDSAGTAANQHSMVNADAAPTATPATGVTANTAANTDVFGPVPGAPTQHFAHP